MFTFLIQRERTIETLASLGERACDLNVFDVQDVDLSFRGNKCTRDSKRHVVAFCIALKCMRGESKINLYRFINFFVLERSLNHSDMNRYTYSAAGIPLISHLISSCRRRQRTEILKVMNGMVPIKIL